MEQEEKTAKEDVSKQKLKGLLALITGPIAFSPFDENELERFITTNNPRRTRRKQRRSQMDDNESSNSMIQSIPQLDSTETEFTLFYFTMASCRHCLQFTPIFSKFIQSSSSCQCLCIPLDRRGDDEEEDSLFYRGLGFYALPAGHENLGAITMVLSVTSTPFVAVIRNDNGMIVTDKAKIAIERCPDQALDAWRRGASGVPLLSYICTVS